ncbi:histidine kinase [Actinoplanes utahensis]|uniref:histidine kinase n=1 Tax=Actinoplanes utahensis TaxID=1869 RepID=A0A0A6UG67_ACTUT|nr:histidine kinase [Actinoplanes utahensis]
MGARIRGRAWDATAILVSWFGGLLLIGDAASFRHFSDEAMALFFALGCLFSLTLWWRRRHPTRVAVFLAVAALATDGAGIAALIAYYTVVSRRRGRDVVVATVVNLVGATAYLFLFPDPSVPWPFGLLLAVAFIASTLAAGMAARSRRELIESLRERAARAEEEARLRADRLRALERERIAREMHDALAHRISMVSLHAGALQIRPDLTPGEVARAATTIRDSAHHALEDLREILGVLRAGPGDALRPQPGLEHLGELVAEAERAGVRVDLRDRLGDRPVSGSLGRTVYRLVQEGLTNAGKHAGGALVTVLLDRAPDGALHVLVSNPLLPGPRAGSGRTEVPGAGSGLVGLAERVDLLDGRMRHGVRGDPRTGLTFDLEAWLPWPTPSGS